MSWASSSVFAITMEIMELIWMSYGKILFLHFWTDWIITWKRALFTPTPFFFFFEIPKSFFIFLLWRPHLIVLLCHFMEMSFNLDPTHHLMSKKRARDAVPSLNLLDLWMEYSRSHSWKEIEGANVGSYWQWYRLASSAHRPGTSLWWPAGQTQGMKDFHTIEWKCVRLQIYSCIQTPIFRRDVSLWRTISVMKDLPQSPLLLRRPL